MKVNIENTISILLIRDGRMICRVNAATMHKMNAYDYCYQVNIGLRKFIVLSSMPGIARLGGHTAVKLSSMKQTKTKQQCLPRQLTVPQA
jgi:hypothetical protein